MKTSLALFLSLSSLAWADVKLPAIFSDHAVLQRDASVPVWGWAGPGEEVTVSIGTASKITKADAAGKWRVNLDKLSAGDGLTMTVKGRNTLTVSDVAVGEVWLGSGQSNMGMRVNGALNFPAEQKAANYPQLRMFTVTTFSAETPQEDTQGAWVVCTPETVQTFSATAYFFGRDLHLALKRPVGMINSSVGGTRIEAWISKEAQEKEPSLKDFLKQNDETRAAFDETAEKAKFDAEMAKWNEAAAKAKAANQPLPPGKPRDPIGTHVRATVLGNLFNGKIAPLIPYAMRGVIWYQGESNASPQLARFYETQLPLLIHDWRTRWGREDLPFGFVQLPNIERAQSWVTVREAQLRTLKLPHTGMAVTLDVGEAHNVHPANKQAVGKRLAAWALGDVYKVPGTASSGPVYASQEIADGKITLAFTHTDGGLKVRGEALHSFQVAGADRKWKAAQATIKEDKVIVSSPDAPQPVAVRYAWTDNPLASLFNGAGLPASPFRTDAWEDELTLPAIFSDHLVLQADTIVPVWGWAVPGEEVTVTFAGVSKSIKAGVDGKWMIRLGKFKASSDPQEMVVKAGKIITIKDVLVGEVWIASGQSNMAYMFSRGAYPEEERLAANLPQVRMFTVKQSARRSPQSDCEGSWVVSTPDTVAPFSAVAYFFGRELHLALKQPVGMIHSSWGGTDIAAWTSEAAQVKVPALKAKLDEWQKNEAAYDSDAAHAKFATLDALWKDKVKEAKAAGTKPPPRPKLDQQPAADQNHPANLYNGMISPLLPYAVRGAIWYQGEHNCSTLEKATLYKTQLPLLVQDWRTRWASPEMPFAWVQLPNFEHVGFRPLVREAMLQSLSVKNTGMAIAVDIGNPTDNHPSNKQDVGRRLSLWALGSVYHKEVAATSGPLYRGFDVGSGRIALTFEHANGGLVAKDGELKGFVIAGQNKVFKPAQAKIENGKVVVSSAEVPEPAAVRYAWESSPVGNLYNAAGLPASPFRTDEWPIEDLAARPAGLPVVDLSKDASRQVVIAQGTDKVYQGHPTTVLLPDGKTMYCVWTYGHGGGCGPLKRSDDGGLTWSELLPVPENWTTVRNCPSIYRLTDPAGKARLIVYAGQGPDKTMHQAVSEDDGKSWTPMASNGLACVMPFCTIVPIEGGKKLLGLTNTRRPGETKDKTSNIITQSVSTDGGLTWAPWTTILDMGDLKPCEPHIIRSPDGKQLLCLLRENLKHVALYITSDDEGRTWSAPKSLPFGLHGDRHMAHYAPDGRLVVCFRDTGIKSPTKTHFVGWVGRYEDIINGKEGQYRLKLIHSYKGGDCGYPGLEFLPDGTLVATTYIKYREGPELNSVVSVRFKLTEIDAMAGKK